MALVGETGIFPAVSLALASSLVRGNYASWAWEYKILLMMKKVSPFLKTIPPRGGEDEASLVQREVDFCAAKRRKERKYYPLLVLQKLRLSLSLAIARQLPRQREPGGVSAFPHRFCVGGDAHIVPQIAHSRGRQTGILQFQTKYPPNTRVRGMRLPYSSIPSSVTTRRASASPARRRALYRK